MLPPLDVHSSAAPTVAPSASAALAPSETSASGPRPAAPTEVIRSHALAPMAAPNIANATTFAFIGASAAIGERVTCSLSQGVGTTADRREVRPPLFATASLDPQLAPHGQKLATARR